MRAKERDGCAQVQISDTRGDDGDRLSRTVSPKELILGQICLLQFHSMRII